MRKAKPKKRILLPDPKYKDILVTKFVNDLMVSGKKSIAYGIFYDALDIVESRTKKIESSAIDIWKKSLNNITPAVEVKSKHSRKRSGRSMAEKLATEIVAAYNSEGGAFKKKEDTHRMAEANKAFAHFRF
ncbi:MAG: 30S ribosomal protein S7 [Bacteroidetes bacterium 4572_128]|nr:MAG: 30S ribosomal protein S7 [Bacteroidetes bacterium 4572_128]